MEITNDEQLKDYVSSLVEREVERSVPTTLVEQFVDEDMKRITSLAVITLSVTAEERVAELVRGMQEIKAKERKIKSKEEKEAKLKEEEIQRFDRLFRTQHLMMIVFISLLIITGLPIKFHDSMCANLFFKITGGWGISAIIHRVAACGLALTGLFHIYYVTATKNGRRDFLLVMPKLKDVRDLVQTILYFFGIQRHRPRFGRFSYVEKFEFWAVYWGMVVMIVTGSILWFESISLKLVSKYVIDIAKEVHSGEGLLATVAIILWHFYNVHLAPNKFPISWTFWTGRVSLEDMAEEHPEELDELVEKGTIEREKIRAPVTFQ